MFSRQTAGHAFKGLANFVEFNQLGMAQGHDLRLDMRHPHQQALAFKAVDRLAQRPAADAVGARQFRLGDFAARRDIAFDDGGLNTPEDVLTGFPSHLEPARHLRANPAYCRHLENQ